MKERAAKGLFIASAFFLTAAFFFAYGLAVQRYRITPYELVHAVYDAARSIWTYGAVIPEGRRVLAPPYASRERITLHDPSHMSDGYYVFVGWDEPLSRYAAWLYNHRGEHLHTWPLDYATLNAASPSDGDGHPHAVEVLSDGSVIASFDHGYAMAQFDTCGNPVWTKTGVYHHSLERADDGSFWAWRADGISGSQYQYMENFDAETGNTIREIALVEDLIENMGPASVIFGLRPDFHFERFDRTSPPSENIFHPNDVDVLHSNIAHMFPMFEAGDLLISLRRVNLVAIVDPDDLRVKWWSHGPWLSQHDPDFTADGKISVYNNNTGRGRSEIVKIDPATRAVSNDLFHGQAIFYSDSMGKHQYLPNGNVLIAVPGEGRIIEVSSGGDYVMEFNNLSLASLRHNEHIENALWVPADFFSAMPGCTN